jgi:hypothetical protein
MLSSGLLGGDGGSGGLWTAPLSLGGPWYVCGRDNSSWPFPGEMTSVEIGLGFLVGCLFRVTN